MSNLEANKATARAYFERIAAGDAEGTAALFTENGAIILPSKTLMPPEVRGRDNIRQLIAGIGELFPQTGLKVIPDLMTAEDNRVAIIGHSDAVHVSGKPYANRYHFLLVFEDGKIAESHEYMDTLHLTDVFFDGAKPEA